MGKFLDVKWLNWMVSWYSVFFHSGSTILYSCHQFMEVPIYLCYCYCLLLFVFNYSHLICIFPLSVPLSVFSCAHLPFRHLRVSIFHAFAHPHIGLPSSWVLRIFLYSGCRPLADISVKYMCAVPKEVRRGRWFP